MVESSESKVLKFIHRFSHTLSCELQIPAAPPAPGQLLSLTCCWSGRPKPKHIAAYRQWVLATNRALADRWRQRILYGLGTAPNLTEIWAFEPGRPQKLPEKMDVGIF